ncbi:Hypothetical protein (Fragment) [Durusdinium trenchii]|uniref:Uncharacterized protein n=1 Tax=Durusdinium trenchii TaxID=1381693 RepID=A0ABP0IIS0_9DINO
MAQNKAEGMAGAKLETDFPLQTYSLKPFLTEKLLPLLYPLWMNFAFIRLVKVCPAVYLMARKVNPGIVAKRGKLRILHKCPASKRSLEYQKVKYVRGARDLSASGVRLDCADEATFDHANVTKDVTYNDAVAKGECSVRDAVVHCKKKTIVNGKVKWVDDLVEHLVSVFREGVIHFVEELDSKLQFEFQAMERKELQLRVERQALDEMRKSLKEEQTALETRSKSFRKSRRSSQLKVRFCDSDGTQIQLAPELAADFLAGIDGIDAEVQDDEALSGGSSLETSRFQRQSITGSYCKRAPRPCEIVSIQGREYSTLPPRRPDEQERERLKNCVVAIPDGWEANDFSATIDEVSRHNWGNPLIAVQCQTEPRLFATYRTLLSNSGKCGTRYRTESRHVVSLPVKELPTRAEKELSHLRFCHDFGRLVIRKKSNRVMATE